MHAGSFLRVYIWYIIQPQALLISYCVLLQTWLLLNYRQYLTIPEYQNNKSKPNLLLHKKLGCAFF